MDAGEEITRKEVVFLREILSKNCLLFKNIGDSQAADNNINGNPIRKIGEGSSGIVYGVMGPAGEYLAVKIFKKEEWITFYRQEPTFGGSLDTGELLYFSEQGNINSPILPEVYYAENTSLGGLMVSRLYGGKPGPENHPVPEQLEPKDGALGRALELFECLANIHSSGFLVGDIKNDNIISGVVIDLGWFDHFKNINRKKSSGTPSYSPPESLCLLDHGTALGGPAEVDLGLRDVWAMGSSLYKDFVGELPYDTFFASLGYRPASVTWDHLISASRQLLSDGENQELFREAILRKLTKAGVVDPLAKIIMQSLEPNRAKALGAGSILREIKMSGTSEEKKARELGEAARSKEQEAEKSGLTVGVRRYRTIAERWEATADGWKIAMEKLGKKDKKSEEKIKERQERLKKYEEMQKQKTGDQGLRDKQTAGGNIEIFGAEPEKKELDSKLPSRMAAKGWELVEKCEEAGVYKFRGEIDIDYDFLWNRKSNITSLLGQGRAVRCKGTFTYDLENDCLCSIGNGAELSNLAGDGSFVGDFLAGSVVMESGTFKNDSGFEFTGKFGTRPGEGMFKSGTFKEGQSDGSIYIGRKTDGKKDGRGTITFPDRYSYVCSFSQGVETLGSKFRGWREYFKYLARRLLGLRLTLTGDELETGSKENAGEKGRGPRA
ncbi:MAG: hypothetical protein LBU15_01175 [Rickettsiales bacterium]|jgi:hypothetical protein|nr:hypothetical protein [Rickettsiales bacterium]